MLSKWINKNHDGTRSIFREPFKTPTVQNFVLKWPGSQEVESHSSIALILQTEKTQPLCNLNTHDDAKRKPQGWELSKEKSHFRWKPRSTVSGPRISYCQCRLTRKKNFNRVKWHYKGFKILKVCIRYSTVTTEGRNFFVLEKQV